MFRYFNSIREQADPEGPFPAAPAAAPGPEPEGAPGLDPEAAPVPGPEAAPAPAPGHGGFCDDPCPCCYYTISKTVNGKYTTGWRLFGGHWSWWHKGAPHCKRIVGDHADERETSLIMHLHPDLVLPKSEWGPGTDNRWKLKAVNEKWSWAQRAWSKATNDTGSGDPQHSTAEKGKQYLEALGAKIATYLIELAAADISALYEPSK